MILYLVRHAQCMPKRSQAFSEWALSPVGAHQAEELAGLLEPLEIANVFSSPFTRTLETARPFAQKRRLAIRVVDALRERLLTNERGLPSDEVWRKSWEDFSFCLPGCESSLAAQARICGAIRDIVQTAEGTSAIFTHGNVIPLFLNALRRTVGRADAEALTNPDVLKISWRGGAFTWDRAFRLSGLARIATDHTQTPTEQETPASNPQGGANGRQPSRSDTNRTSVAAASRRSP
jgi:2,3-bisphosphoglycerate-dependent phosphoglycerate mutase